MLLTNVTNIPPQAYLFFRGKGGIAQAKHDAALAVFKAQMQNQSAQNV